MSRAAKLCMYPWSFLEGTVFPAKGIGLEATDLLWETPGRHCWLEGGRSLLLESAQEATLSSVATPRFARQSNGLGISRLNCACR
jgi:hypothetical protein